SMVADGERSASAGLSPQMSGLPSRRFWLVCPAPRSRKEEITMSNLPCIIICAASVATDVNLVIEAQGKGPNAVSRGLCAIDPSATHETPATHFMMQDMSAQGTDGVIWQGIPEG